MEESLIISDACIGCGKCVKVCIRGHLAVGDDKKVHEIESPYYCFECGHCSSVCPKGAIRMKRHPEEQTDIDGCPVGAKELSELLRQRRSQRWFDRKCTKEELSELISSVGYAPTAENSQAVQFAVIDERFNEFMELLASILRSHTHEHARLKQFVDYVDAGQEDKNNPFTHIHDALQYPIVALTMGGVDFAALRRTRDTGGYSALVGTGESDYGAL